jgi:hypothetical protein
MGIQDKSNPSQVPARKLNLLPLAILAGTLVACGQIAAQVPPAGQVPDESVVPRWSATFSVILKAREGRFLSYRATPKVPDTSKPQLGALSDEELINGKNFQRPLDIPKLG